eukprot:scaffold64769_cov64-Phaeocystis_antarctica.AAC.1
MLPSLTVYRYQGSTNPNGQSPPNLRRGEADDVRAAESQESFSSKIRNSDGGQTSVAGSALVWGGEGAWASSKGGNSRLV